MSATTAFLKKLFHLLGKAVIRQLLLGVEVDEVRCQATRISVLNG